jgi:biofilm PGA synthesis lipoprotein PgaB
VRVGKISIIFIAIFSLLYFYNQYLIAQLKRPYVAALMFHSIIDSGPRNEKEDGDVITSKHLRNDLIYLKKRGYQYVNTDGLISILGNTGSVNKNVKNIFVTFDDGYKNNYTKAFPILKELNINALISVVVYYIQNQNTSVNGRSINGKYMTWDDINEMLQSGLIEIGSHSYNSHYYIPRVTAPDEPPSISTRTEVPALAGRKVKKGIIENRNMYVQRITHDLQNSKKYIYENTAVASKVLTYPFGWSSYEARKVARKLGFSVQVGIRPGVNTSLEDLSDIKRIVVKNSYTPKQIEEKINFCIGIKNLLP